MSDSGNVLNGTGRKDWRLYTCPECYRSLNWGLSVALHNCTQSAGTEHPGGGADG